jgi:hypothetical protein
MLFTVLLSTLVVLALIDSTSFGTLLIPVWLLMTSTRVRIGSFFVYLSTVAGLYFLAGLIIMFSADTFLKNYNFVLESNAFLYGQIALGILLMVISQLMDTKKARARAAERAERGEGRILKWRNRIMGDSISDRGSVAMLIGLALTAVVVELGTMLPYLAAIGLITSEGPSWPMSGILLFGYCIVMVLPAIILLIGRLVAYRVLKEPLVRWDKWLVKHAQSTTAWIIGIVGFLLTVNAVYDAGWVG